MKPNCGLGHVRHRRVYRRSLRRSGCPFASFVDDIVKVFLRLRSCRPRHVTKLCRRAYGTQDEIDLYTFITKWTTTDCKNVRRRSIPTERHDQDKLSEIAREDFLFLKLICDSPDPVRIKLPPIKLVCNRADSVLVKVVAHRH